MPVSRQMAHPVRRKTSRRGLAVVGGFLVAAVILTASVGISTAASPRADASAPTPAASAHVLHDILVAAEGSRPPGPLDAGAAAPGVTLAAAVVGGAPSSAVAAAAASPTPAPSLAASAYVRPATADGPVPANLRPTLAAAPKDYPAPYLDGCHVPLDGVRPRWACVYGKTTSRTTIALFGDSHALSWFPAVLQLANDKGWRLLSLTMSACSPSDIPEWIPAESGVSAACTGWRTWAVARLAKEKPLVVIVAGTRGFATVGASGDVLTGDARIHAWEAGIERTLDRIGRNAGRVIYLSDTPASRLDPPTCLAQHKTSVLACATPVSQAVNAAWLTEEHHVAISEDAGFIDTTTWVCPSGPCPVTLGSLLIYRDGGHMTATFAASLGRRLEQAVAADLARHPPRGKTP